MGVAETSNSNEELGFRDFSPSLYHCKIPGVVNKDLLTFEAFPERVVLEGFDEEILRGLGLLMARVSDGGACDAAYGVVASGDRVPRRPAAGTAPRRRRPRRRHVHRDGEDVVQMPGGRLRLAPGRSMAVVEWEDAGSVVDGFVAITLLEIAMSHALAMRGYVVNHAAAIEIDGTALLAVGPTHAGKSTLSAAALAAGGAVVSDDSVILGLDGEGAPSAGALRRDLWLRDGSVDLLPEALRDRLWETASFGERRWGLERAAFPEIFRTRILPRAIVLLRRDLRVRGFALRRVSSADGLAGLILASSALFLSGRYPVERERCMPGLLALANSAPCFEVRMGRALIEEPAATVQRLVEDVRS
jgi:hypothetical protein